MSNLIYNFAPQKLAKMKDYAKRRLPSTLHKLRKHPTEEDYMNAIGNSISTLSSLKRLRPYINIDGSIEFWKDDNFIVFKMIDSIVEDYIVSFKCVLNQNALNYLDIENNVNSRVYTQELYIERMNKRFDIMVIRGYEKSNNSSTGIINKLNDEEDFYLSDDGKTILGWKRASGSFGKSLKHSISIPDHVEKIADFAFAGCDNLGYVFIPKSVKYIGNFAFAGCGTIDFAFESDSLDFLGESAFYGCRIKGPDRYVQSFYMPNSIVKCHKKAFNNAIIRGGYGKDKYVQLYKGNNENLMKLADYEFMSKENEILKLRKECNNDAAINIEGILYDSSRKYIIRCENKNIKTLHIPQGVKGIFYEAFCACGDLENVIFNDDIEFIAENAFRDTNIENLILPKSVNYIGQRAFLYCKGRSINIPSSVRYLGRSIYCIDKIYTTREQYLEFSNKEPRLYKPILEVSDIRKIDDSTYEITE